MGQSQSTGSTDNQDGAEPGRSADYYELLGVERDATDEEIKKAYRRKALELHPDRNYGQVEAATKLFADVQCAYEVLSDPQERAWYDTHQYAEVLDDAQQEQTATPTGGYKITSAHILSLVLNFNPHKMEFSDSPSGFFGGLKDIFEQIAMDEGLAHRWDYGTSDSSDPVDYPSFGSKDDSFDEVVRPFYAVWTSFSTKKSFSWKDKYKYSEAPDRRVRRLMEKENKKMREDGIREYNDAVRSLVAFVKKRDPRYKSNIQTEAERQRSLRESAAAQAARSRAANQAKIQDHVIPEWARTDGNEEEGGIFSSEEESEVEHFECVVCNKTFKSNKQYEAHERSKKHIKAVKQLRREMLIEDDELNLVDEVGLKPEQEESRDEDDKGSVQESPPLKEVSLSPSLSTPGSDVDEADYVDQETLLKAGTRLGEEGISSSAGDDDDKGNDENEHEDLKAKATKLGKAKQKRAKKLAAQATSDAQLKCAHCHAAFTSRTQLFTHLRETGHAQPVSKAQSGQKKKGKSKK